jgi:GDPmannose 4,6-dehydratase
MKVALITGVTGQDGSYLAELLIAKGYVVHGLIRRASTFNTHRIDHLFTDPHAHDASSAAPRLVLHYGDLLDADSLASLIHRVEPDEVYHLAAQSHVRVSFDIPVYTAETGYLGTLRMLEAIRTYRAKPVRFYQASSSEMYGGQTRGVLNEDSPLRPRSPYAIGKVASYWQAVNYREGYGMFATNGILFNHESPRRGETFVTRKITRGLAMILAGRERHVYLGNLDAKRDWGFAGDYVEAMWRMLQHERPDDFVIATGVAHSVREFLELSCGLVSLAAPEVVRIDERYYRPTEVDELVGDPSKAERVLGWKAKMSFEELAATMLLSDLKSFGVDTHRYDRLHELAGNAAAR